MRIPKFLKNASNVYRTKTYIIVQELTIRDKFQNEHLASYDTFYYRNEERDKQFNEYFKNRRCLEGKRICCNFQIKHYVK